MCYIEEGVLPLQFDWYMNGNLLSKTFENQKYRIETDQEESRLTITKLEANDSGNYSCVARNEFGFDDQSTQLSVKGLISTIFICLPNNMWRAILTVMNLPFIPSFNIVISSRCCC